MGSERRILPIDPEQIGDIARLEPIFLRRILHPVHFDDYQFVPSFRSIGYQSDFGSNIVFISPHNFSELSYLNLAAMWYAGNPTNTDGNFVVYALPGNNPLELFVTSYAMGNLYIYLRYRMHLQPEIPGTIENLLWFAKIYNMITDINLAKSLFTNLLEMLYLLHNDSSLVVNLIETFCVPSFPIREVFLSPDTNLEFLRFILRNANRAQFNIRQFLTGNIGTNRRPFCPVLESLLDGNTSALEIFLSYGFEREECIMRVRNIMYFRYFRNVTGIRIRLPVQDFYDHHSRRRHLLLETFLVLHRFAYRENINYLNRMTDWIHSGCLVFRSIPDPLITETEIHKMLVEGRAADDMFETICATSERYFGEIIVENYEPRTLKHLTRCIIRSTLRDNFQLPTGIRRLDLPKNLVSYLRLQY